MDTNDDTTTTDTEHILEAEALFLRGLDHLRIVALRSHTRDRKAAVMRQARERTRAHDAVLVLSTPEPLDLAG